MQPIRSTATARNTFIGMLAVMILFSFGSCATKARFSATKLVPAARGYVKVERNDDLNYVIQIHLSDLVEVSRLKPVKRTYVVWMVTDQYTTKNLGQVKSARVNFSNKLTASFQAVSSLKPAKIFITAENDGTIRYPGVQVVLSTNRF